MDKNPITADPIYNTRTIAPSAIPSVTRYTRFCVDIFSDGIVLATLGMDYEAFLALHESCMYITFHIFCSVDSWIVIVALICSFFFINLLWKQSLNENSRPLYNESSCNVNFNVLQILFYIYSQFHSLSKYK